MSNSQTYYLDETTNDKRIIISGDNIQLTRNLLTTPQTNFLNQNGLTLNYDGTTTNPKSFSLTSNGINFTDTNYNYTTPLNNLANAQSVISSLGKNKAGLPNPSSSGLAPLSTWTTRTTPSGFIYSSIAWSPTLNLYVALRNFSANTSMVSYSSNGISWTTGTSDIAYGNASQVVWAPKLGLFCAGVVGTNVITSSNGINWTSRTTPMSVACLVWSEELSLFVGLGNSNTGCITSPDGINWTARTLPAIYNWSSITWSAELNMFVAVSTNLGPTYIMYSFNGINWTLADTSNIVGISLSSICWSRELYLFVGCAGSVQTTTLRIITSSNGINWTQRSVPTANNVRYGNINWVSQLGLFIALSSNTTNIITSQDGINWSIVAGPTGKTMSAGVYSPEEGLFVICCADGSVTNNIVTSSLKGRPPTSFNIFNNTYQSIDETGLWTFNQINANIQSQNTTQNLTHFIGMFDSSVTGYGKPQKTANLNFNPSTSVLTITDGVNSTIITPTSNPATGINTTTDNTNTTCYLPFTKTTAGTNQLLYVDDTTGPLTYNPSTSTLTASTFSGTSTGIQLTGNSANAERSVPFSNSNVGGARTLLIDTQTNPFQYNAGLQRLNVPYIGLTNTIDNTPSFSTGTLTLNTTSNTFSYYNWSFNQTTASGNITALTLTNFRAGGIYVLFFTNSSGGAITWNTGLGANILTNYSTARILNNGSKAVIKIMFDGTTYYVEYTGY